MVPLVAGGHLLLGKYYRSRTPGIELPIGELVKEVEDDGYRYLGVLELDKVKEKEMKKIYCGENFRSVSLVMKSRLNGRNQIMAVNTRAVSLMRYGARLMRWKDEELGSLDRKTRKIMTMNRELYSKSDVARLYEPRKLGGGGLIGCEICVQNVWDGM